jgi:WD40 repeat protein
MKYKYKILSAIVVVSILLCVLGILNISHYFDQSSKNNTVSKIKSESLIGVTPREFWRYDGSRSPNKVAFSPDGRLLACRGSDYIEIWDWKSDVLKDEFKLDDQDSAVYSIVFSPDSKYLAAGGQGDNFLNVWNLSTKKPVLVSFGYHGVNSKSNWSFVAAVDKVEFTPDSQFLITETGSKIRIWDMLEGVEIYTFYDSSKFAISPNRTTLAAYSDDSNSIIFWDLKTKKEFGKISTDNRVAYGICFSPNGKSLAYYAKNLIVICDIEKMEEVFRRENDGYVTSIAYFPCGQYLLSVINQNALTGRYKEPWQVYADVIDLNNDEILMRYKSEALLTKVEVPEGDWMYSGEETFWKAVSSPDGRNIAVCCLGGKVLLWETPEMFLNKTPEKLAVEN